MFEFPEIKAFSIVVASVFFIGVLLTAVSCTSDTKPIDTEADLTGFITEIYPAQGQGIYGRISAESHADKIITKYNITIRNDTRIFRQDDRNYIKIDFAELKTQQWIKVWFSGPVMESWPLQATAKQVIVFN